MSECECDSEEKDSYCRVHIDQVATLAALKSRMNMLIALTAAFGSLGVGILMAINTTTNTLAVNIATLNNEMKTLSSRVVTVEERLFWCEKEIHDLKELTARHRQQKERK